jgi:transcriptional regulator with XRE-family HTH domain
MVSAYIPRVMFNSTQLELLRAEPVRGTNRLGRAMRLAGVTQVQLAEGAGLSQPYVSAILNSRAPRLPLATAHRLAEFFGCAIEDLFPAPDSREGAA